MPASLCEPMQNSRRPISEPIVICGTIECPTQTGQGCQQEEGKKEGPGEAPSQTPKTLSRVRQSFMCRPGALSKELLAEAPGQACTGQKSHGISTSVELMQGG